VLSGIFWVLRSGAPWRDLPETYGARTTCYNRFVRWRRAGVWDRIMDALAAGHDAAVQMIDTSVVRVHQHEACISDNNHQAMGRSRGGLTSKIHAVVDTNGLPVHLALTPGEAHDNRLPPCSRCNISFVSFEGTQFWTRTPTRSMQVFEGPGQGHSVSNQF
jgi:transposase